MSLIVLRIIVPSVRNSSAYRGVQEISGIPVVVLSGGDRGRSVMSKFGRNTSSCLAGPFGGGRLLIQVRTLLEESSLMVDSSLFFRKLG